MEYPKSQWVTLDIDLPHGIHNGNLRLDPSNKSGTISIKNISIIDNKSHSEIWRSDFSNNFVGCKVLGNDVNFSQNNCLMIQATTDDPQILLKLPIIDRSAKMKISLRHVDNIIGKNQMGHLNGPEIAGKLGKIFRYVKAAISN